MANVSAKKTGTRKEKRKERDNTEKLDNSKQSQRCGLPTEISSYSCCGVDNTVRGMPIANVLQTTQKFAFSFQTFKSIYSEFLLMGLHGTSLGKLCHQFLRFCEAFQGSRKSIPDQVATACLNCYEQPVNNQRRTRFMLLTRDLTSEFACHDCHPSPSKQFVCCEDCTEGATT